MRERLYLVLIIVAVCYAALIGTAGAQEGSPTLQGFNTTLVDLINDIENLSTFATAIEVANLTENLSAEGPFTVFGANNEAFDLLGNETVDELFNDTEELERVLLFHVVEGNYTVDDIMNMTEETNETTLETLAGENLTITLRPDGILSIGESEAFIVVEDLAASNGMLHVVDRVLMPPPVNVTPIPMPTPTETATTGIAITDLDLVNETVTVTAYEPVNLTGWTITDEGMLHTYVFPPFVLQAGETVTVHTGPGNDTATDLYWGRGSPVWNNDGDIATLADADGKVVSVMER
jgi:uncharacterized surface protein with fasciclin (FAS1) repeats